VPIFISYSHQDSEFAALLAAQLVKHKAKVWIDPRELHEGDSLIERIQDAIQGASALLVVLSKFSIESEWCKKELSSGLLRELEEKRVIVLPVLIEDCEIPLFLRGKLYADFSTDFDKGLKAVLEAIARVSSEALGRHEEPEWHLDWSVDWGMLEDVFSMRITMVEQAKDQPYSVLTEIRIIANDIATRRYLKFEEAGIDWIERGVIVSMLAEGTYDKDLRIFLEDQFQKNKEIIMADQRLGTSFIVDVSSRRLGEDTGRDILLDLGGQLRIIAEAQRQAMRKPTSKEITRMKEIQAYFDSA
jgi:hypothetical protein